MKKKLTIKGVIFYIILIAIMIPLFQYAIENNSLYHMLSHSYTSEEIRTFLEAEYSHGIQLENYQIDKTMIKIKEEDSKPVLYCYFVTGYSREQEELIFKDVKQVYKKMQGEAQITEYFYKIRFRVLSDDKVIYKHTYSITNWTMNRLIYVILALMIGFSVRMYYGIRATIKARQRRKFLGGDEIYNYSKSELEYYLQTHDKDDRAYMRLSEIYISEGKVEQAFDAVVEANNLNPYERDYILHYGYLLTLLEEYKEALGVHNQLVKIKTFFTDYALLCTVAFLYYKNGKIKTARRYYKHAYRVCKKRRFRNDNEAQNMKRKLEKILYSQ